MVRRKYVEMIWTRTCNGMDIKNPTLMGMGWSAYLYEVDEMVVLVMGTDGGEELSEGSVLSGGELPVGHVKA